MSEDTDLAAKREHDERNEAADASASASSNARASSDDEGVALPTRTRRQRRAEIVDNGGGNPWVRRALVFGLGAAAAAICGLVLVGMQEGAVYAKPVDELVSQKARFAGRPVRAEGNLVHGTLVKRDSPCEYRFTIEKNGTQVPVRFAQCVVPDTFRDVPGMDVGVTVEGELRSDNTFEATTVLAKCPSKYEMKERQQKGEKMPHASTDPAGY
jgi:cytochrome c-type biogenesis protein CcmE